MKKKKKIFPLTK